MVWCKVHVHLRCALCVDKAVMCRVHATQNEGWFKDCGLCSVGHAPLRFLRLDYRVYASSKGDSSADSASALLHIHNLALSAKMRVVQQASLAAVALCALCGVRAAAAGVRDGGGSPWDHIGMS